MDTLFTVRLRFEHDVVIARQRAREVADALGFGSQDQVRIATAVSELARLVFADASSGDLAFRVDRRSDRDADLVIRIAAAAAGTFHDDAAPVQGARRLLERVVCEDGGGGLEGRQTLPPADIPDAAGVDRIRRALLEQDPTNPFEELQNQNEDLVNALATLREREAERSRLLEAERTARERAQRAVRDREEVLSVVSHDLRNPIGAILTGVQFLLENPALLDDLSAGNPEAVGRRQLDAIRRSAERAERLIRDLLDASSMEDGKLSVRRSREDPATILAEVEELHAGTAEDRGIVLRVESPPLPAVCADRARMVQALSNLVGNAIKFTPRGGEVRVDATVDGDEVVFTVSDTGPGIEPDHLEHLFDRFWQAGDHGEGGAGLGLAIVKGIVEGHDGWIRVESEPGRGTRFVLGISLADEACGASGRGGSTGAGKQGVGAS